MFRSIGHNTMFIVTDEGVIAMDPIAQTNPRADQLYRAAIASVTDQPVRYLIYSHEHADHIEGGAIFADTAQVVSHRRAAAPIAARNDPRTPVPTILFDDHLTLELGGKTVELYYTGRNHTDNSLVLLYPARRLLFAVDFIPVSSLPFRTLAGDYPDDWIESLRWIEQNLDFDVLVPGHGRLGTRDTPREVREYFQDLMAAIRAAQARGLADNSPEMIEAVRADLGAKYSSWGNWGPWLPENVEGILRSWAAR
jgi:glyoxylase-like metal-dependent hydrolase (beta-lactamase superfamily II)